MKDPAARNWGIITNVLVLALLGVAIHIVRGIPTQIKDMDPQLSGQSITRGGVTTERESGETLEDWRDRHLEAEEEFAEED